MGWLSLSDPSIPPSSWPTSTPLSTCACCFTIRGRAVSQVRNAGGIFVGEQSPEALGDYTAGPSHVMPTGGTARFFSPIHLADFTKVVTIAAANQKAVERLGPATMTLARAEGLEAHARAVSIRLEKTPVY